MRFLKADRIKKYYWIGFALCFALFIWLINRAFDHSTGLGPVSLEGAPCNTSEFLCYYKGEIKKDQPLSLALQEAGVPPHNIFTITENLKEVMNLRRILPGEEFMLETSPEGEIKEFKYSKSPWHKFGLCSHTDSSYTVYEDSVPLNYTIKAQSGVIEGNLWNSMVMASCNTNLIGEFTEVFRYDIDFFTETQNGDEFALIYEEYSFNGKPVRLGKILAAEYRRGDKLHTGVYFEDPSGHVDYYNLKGRSLKKPLLRSPLNYRRISSYFTHSRYHPILKIYRPHLGVDYAAATGTPVVASGDGVVVYSGWNGGFGNFVKIDHRNGFVTSYGHLSKITSGVRKGSWVKQGQVIGKVGSTGLSTGPHLDYRIQVNGQYVNPLKIAFPEGKPVRNEFKAEFDKKAHNYITLLKILDKQQITSN
ncbi:M23 family metallopeptidase [bacterium]|nr:M23 family metallopeptidase [bacterium]